MIRHHRVSLQWGIPLLLLACLLAIPGCEESSSAKFENFSQSIDDAVAESKSTGRPMMMLFTGSDWCPPCMALEKEVFGQPEFQEWADEHVVLMLVDQPRHHSLPSDIREQNNRLFSKYGISGVPTVLFLDQDQKVIGKLGYRSGGPKPWIQAANDLLSRAQ